MKHASDAHLNDWLEKQELAEAMIPVIGRLYREHGVVTSIHGRSLINQSATDILKAHRFARRVDSVELSVHDTFPLLLAISALEPGPSSIDLAGILSDYTSKESTATDSLSLESYLGETLSSVLGQDKPSRRETTDVVLYGFGRIGRLLARILIGHSGGDYGLRLRAIVVRKSSSNDLEKRANLLRRDSVHGPFDGTISVDHKNSVIRANGIYIQVIYSDDPTSVDYVQYGINNAIVVDNTGRWRDEEGLSRHLESPGATRVVLTAPGKGSLKNIVHGINHDTIHDDDSIITAASCTTNAITPVLKVINDRYGIAHGHVETVHSFTNDQNLIDNFHKGDRRGRSAAINMVLTETGAASAVAKALPELSGKLTGNAIRVPTPNVSMAILNLTLDNPTDKEEINNYLRMISLTSPLHKQIDYIDSNEVVSTDFVGSRKAGIVDGLATISTGKNLVLYVWYDNEFGYSCQVIRVLEEIGQVHPPTFPVITPSRVAAPMH
ncbi:glyceraldehyde-3-phosphate dehydrogenase [Lysinibacter sp. HNR]|uniref:glyceraldehyde-3-phosphate dehydrogenase n=1 Tax=Lysinibacter sp. HNR TaxID=3031408 RepID=UPI0024349459|nr:glyceraldehyde-3-phosphate dehydrogenase [Lysinibacter sp. HNR]WGD38153.1 glyceraldehyde-3-phosphate dehydrogenase [Lysinibacter sp. HNR]